MTTQPIIGASYKVHRRGLPKGPARVKRIVGKFAYLKYPEAPGLLGIVAPIRALRRLPRIGFTDAWNRYARLERESHEADDDLQAFYAPSECYADAERWHNKDLAILEEETGWTIEALREEAARRTSPHCLYKLGL